MIGVTGDMYSVSECTSPRKSKPATHPHTHPTNVKEGRLPAHACCLRTRAACARVAWLLAQAYLPPQSPRAPLALVTCEGRDEGGGGREAPKDKLHAAADIISSHFRTTPLRVTLGHEPCWKTPLHEHLHSLQALPEKGRRRHDCRCRQGL
jgi:hypothetical protein